MRILLALSLLATSGTLVLAAPALASDPTGPQIELVSPAEGEGFYQGESYLVGETITPAYSCHDDVDGSRLSCRATPIDTAPGMHVFRVDSVDSAGNSASATFYPPLLAEPASASVRAGDTLPIKFSLGSDRGLDVIARACWRPCFVTSGDSSTAFGSLSYSLHPDRYTFMRQTDKGWAGSCREVFLALRDGTSHAALVTFR